MTVLVGSSWVHLAFPYYKADVCNSSLINNKGWDGWAPESQERRLQVRSGHSAYACHSINDIMNTKGGQISLPQGLFNLHCNSHKVAYSLIFKKETKSDRQWLHYLFRSQSGQVKPVFKPETWVRSVKNRVEWLTLHIYPQPFSGYNENKVFGASPSCDCIAWPVGLNKARCYKDVCRSSSVQVS